MATPGSTVNVVFVGVCMTVNYGANGATPPEGLPPVRVIVPSVPTSVSVTSKGGTQSFTPAAHTATLYYTPQNGTQTSFALGSSSAVGGYQIQVLDQSGSGESNPNPPVFNMSVASNVPSMSSVLGLQSNQPALNAAYATTPASPNTTVNCWFDITGGTFVACMNTSAGSSGPVLMFAAIPTTSATPVLQITPFGSKPQTFNLQTDADDNAFIQVSNSPSAGATTTDDFAAYYAMLTYPTMPATFPTTPSVPATNPCSGYAEVSGGSGGDDDATARLKKIAMLWRPFFTGAECSNSQYP